MDWCSRVQQCDEKKISFHSDNIEKILGTDEVNHWRDNSIPVFTRSQRENTTVLLGGLSERQDRLIAAALRGVGYRAESLPVPDKKAMRTGKEYGSRGQCNPTYFTVGNLIAFLQHLKRSRGFSCEKINRKYVFFTASGCGPCRFGMYATEYRKALREAGFEGFRLVSLHHNRGLRQGDDEAGLAVTPPFSLAVLKAIIIGDILNVLGYRLRPYECRINEVNQTLNAGEEELHEALENGKNVSQVLFNLRKQLQEIKLNRLQVKPKVFITGEFWAVTTEGEGNYQIQKFIEQEDGEVEVEPVSGKILHNIWEAKYNQQQRELLPAGNRSTYLDWNPVKNRLKYSLADFAYRTTFRYFAMLAGLNNYHIPSMDHLAELSRDYYPLDCQAGEGYLEVARVLEQQESKRSNLVVSIKPFGCMPSSGISDGIQMLVSTKYPDINFISLETTGDSEANVYSRLQMALHKAKNRADNEFDELKKRCNVKYANEHKKMNNYKFMPDNDHTTTASKLLSSLCKC